jgi:hypothetical protein
VATGQGLKVALEQTTPWIGAGLALSIALALIARKPREVDISNWPLKAQASGYAGIAINLVFLLVFAAQVSWWLPAPTIAAGVALWLLASLLPRFLRLVIEVISIFAWPFGLVFAAAAMKLLTG